MRRLVIIAATTLIAVGMLSAPVEAKKAKCKTEQWCKKAIVVEQTVKRDKRGNDWEYANGHRA